MSEHSRGIGSSRRRTAVIALASAVGLAGLFGGAGLPGQGALPGAAPGRALAQNERFDLSVVGQIGGGSAGFAMTEDYLYLGVGPRIAVYDLRQPEMPTQIALTTPFAEVVKGLAVDGPRLYAVGWGGSSVDTAYLAVLDVGDPAHPRLLGQAAPDTMFYPTGAIATRSGRVYVLDSGRLGGDLRVVDASNPADIRFDQALPLRRVADEDQLHVAGDRLWWISDHAGLIAFDLAQPATPREIGRFNPGGASLLGAVFVGDLAYATDAAKALHVVDIRDPAAMTLVHSQSVADEAVTLAVSDGRLHVGHVAGVTTYTLANPRRPEPLSTLELPDMIGIGFYVNIKLAAAHGHAFLMTDDGRLRVIGYADPADPAVVAQTEVLPIVEDVAVDGDIAYVATGWSGLWTLDLSNPADPRPLGAVDLGIDELNPAMLSGLAAADGYAYAFDAWAGTLFVIDATDPAAPSVVGRLDDLPSASGISTIEGIAYADGTLWIPYAGLLTAVAVGDPAAPSILGSVEVPGADSVAVAGSTVFVGGGGERNASTVYVVDAAEPSAPRVLGSHAIPGGANPPGLGLDGRYLYASGSGLTLFDIGVPGAPQQVLRYTSDTENWFSGVAASDGFAYLLGNRVELLDARAAGQVSLAASAAVAAPDYVAGDRITADGAFAYLAAGEAGLYVLDRGEAGPGGEARESTVYLPWVDRGR